MQADTFFALKTAGGSLLASRGFFVREYFLEQLEHMIDNAAYTSVYPRMSLAPQQRFVSKGCYIARLSATEPPRLEAVCDWIVPQR